MPNGRNLRRAALVGVFSTKYAYGLVTHYSEHEMTQEKKAYAVAR
jgi:hypothetical protein